MATPGSFKWVEVISLSSEVEADLCRVLLETEGIQVRIHHSISNRHQPGLLITTGGVKILIPDREVIRASVVLQKAGYLENNARPTAPLTIKSIFLIALVLILIAASVMTVLYFYF